MGKEWAFTALQFQKDNDHCCCRENHATFHNMVWRKVWYQSVQIKEKDVLVLAISVPNPEGCRFTTAERKRGKKNVLECHVRLRNRQDVCCCYSTDWRKTWTVLLKARLSLSFGALELVGSLEAFGRV